MIGVVRLAAEAVAANSEWMAWNLMLALVPLLLACLLFLHRGRRTVAWWLVLGTFVAFLPNAPYVLTDVIHLVDDARTTSSDLVVSLALIPQYAAFFLVGFEAYVLSLLLLGRYLRRTGRARWVAPVELGLHTLCAVGIHLGRFDRLNSWDAVVRPDALWNGVVGLRPAIVLISFVAVGGSYVVMKAITVALVVYARQYGRPALPQS
ncbi:MAG: hypothetical protein QOG87_111 [Actinomycetota bacterium]|jgi:uncharacterized membrane protein